MLFLRDEICLNYRNGEVFADNKNVNKIVCSMISPYRKCYLKYVCKNL